jgi:hypothetical protein
MTPEEMQRTMEFIVEQQAKFASDIQKLSESDDRLRGSQATLTAAVMRIAELLENLETTTAERFRQTDERFRHTDQRFADLAEAQKKTDERWRDTDERLNILIGIVEKQMVRRRNGKKRRKG